MAYVLKIMLLLFKVVDYGQQFFIMGMIPDFRPLEFPAVECYWFLVELGSIWIPIGLQEDTNKGKI